MKVTLNLNAVTLAKLLVVMDFKAARPLLLSEDVCRTVSHFVRTRRGQRFYKLAESKNITLKDFVKFK